MCCHHQGPTAQLLLWQWTSPAGWESHICITKEGDTSLLEQWRLQVRAGWLALTFPLCAGAIWVVAPSLTVFILPSHILPSVPKSSLLFLPELLGMHANEDDRRLSLLHSETVPYSKNFFLKILIMYYKRSFVSRKLRVLQNLSLLFLGH